MKKLLFALTAAFALSAFSTQAADDRCFEMRVYYANDGKLDALHSRFRDHTLGLFEKHGLTNIGYWVPVDNKDNTLIYVIASPNKAAHKKSWKAFINDPVWKAAYKASTADGKLVKKVESTFMNATDYSPIPSPHIAKPERKFELRVYSAAEGKLPGLNARFRDHTVGLFEKHGIKNIGYWVPQDDSDKRLIYVVAHKDQDSRNANFKKFGKDPAWQKARAASEKNGRLLIKKGVKATMMAPTDYSAIK